MLWTKNPFFDKYGHILSSCNYYIHFSLLLKAFVKKIKIFFFSDYFYLIHIKPKYALLSLGSDQYLTYIKTVNNLLTLLSIKHNGEV